MGRIVDLLKVSSASRSGRSAAKSSLFRCIVKSIRYINDRWTCYIQRERNS